MNVKQVIVIRRDLKMRRGKEIAQAAHASQKWMFDELRYIESNRDIHVFETLFSKEELWWLQNGTKKVTVKVSSEKELVELHRKALSLGLTSHLIVDEGLTEFGGIHTKTAVAIGPNNSDDIDKVTGDLELY